MTYQAAAYFVNSQFLNMQNAKDLKFLKYATYDFLVISSSKEYTKDDEAGGIMTSFAAWTLFSIRLPLDGSWYR